MRPNLATYVRQTYHRNPDLQEEIMITPDRIKNVDTLTKFIQYGIIHLNNALAFTPLGNLPQGPVAFGLSIKQTHRNITLIGTGILCLAIPFVSYKEI